LVHRTPALKPGRPRGFGGPAALLALAAAELLWLAWFVREPLPNVEAVSPGAHLTRLHLLIRAVPEVVPGVHLRDSHLGIALARLGQFENLPQRLPIALAAGFILASAVAAGSLVLRGLGLGQTTGRAERVALGFGLGTTGLGLAALIVGRLGWLHPWAIRSGLALPILAEGTLAILGRLRGPRRLPAGPWPAAGLSLAFGAVVGPFLVLMFLGAMLPCVDFDALEYHLQGPKEYYQAGRIAFLPHNVYTSMPFGVEMLHLIGMEVVDDWWLGALVGQLVVAWFAPATAALIVLTAARLGSARAAWAAGVVYLTTPWVYRLAVLPYVEGPLCYFVAALVWAIVGIAGPRGPTTSQGGLVGLLAGGAMAIKYPALISAVGPASAWAAATAWRLRSWRFAVAYAAGVAVVVGPWLVKNVRDTGNPVYPLGYSVFGGRHWDPGRDAQWSAAHGPKAIEAAALVRSAVEVAGQSDWQSPLYAALAPLALLRPGPRRATAWLGGFAAYLFLTWWLLTHRLDRFWLPILPSLAVLAGLGFDAIRSRAGATLLGLVMAAGIGSNLVYCSTELAALNDWTGDLGLLRRKIPELLNPALAEFDAGLPAGARPLLIGQAAVFHLNHRAVYNTVFDDDLFTGLARGRSPEEVRQALAGLGITHVFVDWSEIRRYRSPGNYGFTPFITRDVFAGLVQAGVLGRPTRIGLGTSEVYEVPVGDR
jgi:hypothetical protein